ncbi:MAG TPA: hypothetical protein PK708_08515 [Candidatus Competibacter sp.]|nr:hypothetical protein [Candidatus Competibacter sp.]
MASITIDDLEVNRELDKASLSKVSGGWIGYEMYGPYGLTSNYSFSNRFSNMSFDGILGYTDRLIGRMSNNPFLWNSPSTALNMYNSGYYW